MSSRPLNGGSPLRGGGSSEGKFIIALVVIAVVLAAVAFALFAANQSQDKSLRDRQAELNSVGANLSQVKTELAALSHNYTDLNGQLMTVKENYDNVTQQYLALQNKSTAVDTRLNSFLENDLTIAYTYQITPKQLPDNSVDQVVTVSAYNLGKFEVPNMKIRCIVKVGNVTTEYNQTYTYVRSLDKRQKSWEFGNGSVIEDIWAGVV
jgi:type II secretory pathway pseudopilin PulG